ncbi:MAG: hypothetical protein JO257_10445 [Deltaproteobacteria bacterium]|nr:hypothetical protein [Deltaproteobacteria bacterium]
MRIAVAHDGTLAAVHEPTSVNVLEMPGCLPFAEVGIDPEAGASDVAWLGTPPRLLVLARYAAHSTAHLIDPLGPRTISEIRLESPMKLFGTIGSHALAVGSLGAAVLTATDTHLTPYHFPARTVPTTAGAAGAQFVVAVPGAIEEWDPATRMPKRRLKLPRPSVITALGGSDRVVWMTTQQDPTRIDVIPLVNRGQPRAHDLPEPIAQVTGHPRSDLLAVVGADTGRLYILDLDGRTGMRIIGPDGITRVETAALVIGRQAGVVAGQAKHPIAFVPLDTRDQVMATPASAAAAAPGLSAPEPEVEVEKPRSSLYDEPPPPPAPAPAAAPAAAPAPVAAPAPARPVAKVGAKSAVPAPVGPSISERFSVWRERMRNAQPRTAEASQPVAVDRRPTWRDEAVGWYRAVAAGTAERDAPISLAIDQLIVRLELPPELQPALVLLYGAHLSGDGAAPFDVARVLGRDWNEALGRGQLAARGITTYDDSRVRLSRAIQRALDDLPPETGTLVGEPGTVSLLGPCAVVAAHDVPLVPFAERFLGAVGGAILVGNSLGDSVLLEAQARGAVPMIRTRDVLEQPMIVVADSEHAADQLGLPRID